MFRVENGENVVFYDSDGTVSSCRSDSSSRTDSRSDSRLTRYYGGYMITRNQIDAVPPCCHGLSGDGLLSITKQIAE